MQRTPSVCFLVLVSEAGGDSGPWTLTCGPALQTPGCQGGLGPRPRASLQGTVLEQMVTQSTEL